MGYGIGIIAVVVIMVVVMIMMVDHMCMAVSISMVVVMITPVDTEGDGNNKWIVIRWIISIVVRWIVWHIHRGVYILDDGCGFDDHHLCRSRCAFLQGIIARIARIDGAGRGGFSLWLDDIILAIEILVTNDLHRDFSLVILGDQDDRYILCFLFTDRDLEDK